MICLAILGILSSIAVPSYQSFTYRSEIKSAQADLIALGANFDSRYQRTFAYTAVEKTDDLTEVFSGWNPTSDRFAYSAESSVSGYVLTAIDTSSGGEEGCRILMNEANIRVILSCGNYSGEWL
jgi:type IV pilus assembly protein PilE